MAQGLLFRRRCHGEPWQDLTSQTGNGVRSDLFSSLSATTVYAGRYLGFAQVDRHIGPYHTPFLDSSFLLYLHALSSRFSYHGIFLSCFAPGRRNPIFILVLDSSECDRSCTSPFTGTRAGELSPRPHPKTSFGRHVQLQINLPSKSSGRPQLNTTRLPAHALPILRKECCKVSYAAAHGKHSHTGDLVIPRRFPREPHLASFLIKSPEVCGQEIIEAQWRAQQVA